MITSQDTFNKLLTTLLILYAMVRSTLAWYLNRPIDITSEMILLAGIATHGIHLYSNKIADKAGSNGAGTH